MSVCPFTPLSDRCWQRQYAGVPEQSQGQHTSWQAASRQQVEHLGLARFPVIALGSFTSPPLTALLQQRSYHRITIQIRMFAFTVVAYVLVTARLSLAQTSVGVGSYGCRTDAGITSLTACDALNSTLRSCFAVSTATSSARSCFCQQQVLNNIIE